MRSRLTSLDGSFLRVETPNAHMHVAWSGLFEPHAGASAPERRRAAGEGRGEARPSAALPAATRVPAAADGRAIVGGRPEFRHPSARDRARRARRAGRRSAVSRADGRGAVGAARPLSPAVAARARAAARGLQSRADLQDAPCAGRRQVCGGAGAAAVRPDARPRSGALLPMDPGAVPERRATGPRRVRERRARAAACGTRGRSPRGQARRGRYHGDPAPRRARVRAGPAALRAGVLPQRADRPPARPRPPSRKHERHRRGQAPRRRDSERCLPGGGDRRAARARAAARTSRPGR